VCVCVVVVAQAASVPESHHCKQVNKLVCMYGMISLSYVFLRDLFYPSGCGGSDGSSCA